MGASSYKSTPDNFYTAQKWESNSHFYGRAAAEDILAWFLCELLRPLERPKRFLGRRLWALLQRRSYRRLAETTARGAVIPSQQAALVASSAACLLMLLAARLSATAMATVMVLLPALTRGHRLDHRVARPQPKTCLDALLRPRSGRSHF